MKRKSLSNLKLKNKRRIEILDFILALIIYNEKKRRNQNMKFIVSFILIFSFTLLFAAEFEITSKIKENPAHLGLQMLDEEYKYDNNSELCALLIVRCGVKNINFSNTASKVAQIDKQGEYYITMKKGARYIVLKKDGFGSFKEQFGLVMKSGSVYEMSADEKNPLPNIIPVVITSNQNGAEVFLDGISKGKTQNKMLTVNIDIGSHKIEVIKDGFASQEINETISAENNSFNITLDEIEPVLITIKSYPTGAAVALDGAPQGVTNCQTFMYPSTYELNISLNKYETIEEDIIVSESGNNTFSYELFKVTSQLTINVTPSDATLLINNTVLNGNSKEVGPGKYKIEIEKTGYISDSKTITMIKGENKKVTFELIQKTGNLQVSVNPMEASSVLKRDNSTYKSLNGSQILKDIPIGEYTLHSNLSGYQSETKKITISFDETSIENIILEIDSDLANVKFHSKINVISASYDNISFNIPNELKVKMGKYDFEFEKSGYEPTRGRLSFEKNKNYVVEVNLEPSFKQLKYYDVGRIYMEGETKVLKKWDWSKGMQGPLGGLLGGFAVGWITQSLFTDNPGDDLPDPGVTFSIMGVGGLIGMVIVGSLTKTTTEIDTSSYDEASSYNNRTNKIIEDRMKDLREKYYRESIKVYEE